MTGLKIAIGIGGPASGTRRDWPEVVRYAVEATPVGQRDGGLLNPG